MFPRPDRSPLVPSPLFGQKEENYSNKSSGRGKALGNQLSVVVSRSERGFEAPQGVTAETI